MRSTSETIQLDQSLRQSRTIYVMLAIVFFPFAFGGVTFGLSAIGESIRMLSEGYPAQTVRKLPAPFQSSLFGPYH